jgi:hypothetical protein
VPASGGCVLLVAAESRCRWSCWSGGLTIRSFVKAAEPAGFNLDHVLTLGVSLPAHAT